MRRRARVLECMLPTLTFPISSVPPPPATFARRLYVTAKPAIVATGNAIAATIAAFRNADSEGVVSLRIHKYGLL